MYMQGLFAGAPYFSRRANTLAEIVAQRAHIFCSNRLRKNPRRHESIQIPIFTSSPISDEVMPFGVTTRILIDSKEAVYLGVPF